MKIVKMKIVRPVSLRGLEGAVKVCARYGEKKSGKKRCLQWVPGPGYAEGPTVVGTGKGGDARYFIDEVRQSAEIGRKYRYRKSLPYNPQPGGPGRARVNATPETIRLATEAQAKFALLPSSIQNVVLSIVDRERLPALEIEKLKVLASKKSLPSPDEG